MCPLYSDKRTLSTSQVYVNIIYFGHQILKENLNFSQIFRFLSFSALTFPRFRDGPKNELLNEIGHFLRPS